jgi:hypothetical protein
MAFFALCNKELTAQGFAQLYVNHVWASQGLSKTFISDRDTRLTSAFWREVTVLLGTRQCMSSAFHAPTDGQTENQVLETYLRHFIAPTMTDWDKWLSRAEFANNNSYHESIRATPFRQVLVLGRDPCTPLGSLSTGQRSTQVAAFVEKLRFFTDLARTLLYAAQQRQKAIADRKRIDMDHAVGDQVLLSTKNMMLKHAEPSRKLMPR